MPIVINGDGTITGISVGGLPDGIVDAGTLATDSVDSAELVDGAIDTAHLAADAVTGAKIADDAIDSEHIAADSIDAEHYAAGSVDTTALGADAVTSAKIADDVALGGNPTTTTQSVSNNSTRIATTAYTDAQVATVVDSAPSTLNTLNELAAALGDDANFSTTTATNIAAKLPLAGGAMTGAITTNSTFDGRDVATDGTKLDGIEASADVTDATNVTAAGALMDSEITNLAEVKAFDASDYATAAQGTTADAALPKAGGAMTGAITTNSTFDGVDIATRDAVLTSTTTTANAALPKAGGAMTGAITTNSTFDGVDIATRDAILTSTTTTAGAALPKAGGTMTGAVVGATDTDTSNSGTVDLDFTANTNFVLTLTGNVTSLTASNEVAGQSGFIVFIQDGTGSRTVALHGDYETAGAAGLTLTSTASATDIVPYVVAASSRILLGTPQLAFA